MFVETPPKVSIPKERGVTSKSKTRTKKILKTFNLKFNHIFCPEDVYPFKPHPKIILRLK